MKLSPQINSHFFKLDKHKLCAFLKPVLILFLIYSIGASAIFRANFYYIDDMGRANIGYTGWEKMSRYVSVYLSYLIHTDSVLADISPLTQYIALFFIAISGISLIYLFQGHLQITWIQYVATIPLALSPYFLECLSYKFDAPYMALSILASVVPLLFRHKNILLYFIISTISILMVCMTYQAACGLYPILVIILVTRDWSQKQDWKNILIFIGISVLSYGTGILVFKFLIMKPVDTYVSSEIFSLSEILPGFIGNLKNYYSYVLNDYRPLWLVLTGICIATYLWVFIRDSQQHRLLAAVVGIIAVAFITIIAFGIYPALIQPPFEPRTMYGFPTAVCMLTIAACTGRSLPIGKMACIVLSWCFVVLSFSYGNALAAQAEYTNYRVQMVAESICDLGYASNNEPYYLTVKGTIGFAASVPDDPIVKRLVPVTFCENWYWGIYGLAHYYNLNNVHPITGEIEMDNPVRVVDNILYSIDVSGQNLLITLK